jgi:DNA polymerase-3 subunit beta
VDTKMLLQSAERTAVIASQSANLVKIEVGKNQIILSAQVPDVGAVEEVIEADIQGKDKVFAAFNVRLLTDALKVIDSDKVTIELGENLSPGLLRPKDGPDFTYLVMPIRTKEEAA